MANAAADPAAGGPMIAIVIDDMGVDRQRSARAIALAAPLTMAFLPYADDLPSQAAAARRRGHELLVHLPMEPEGPADPGPGALLLRLSEAENMSRLRAALTRFPGFVGVNNHMGSRFTRNAEAMWPLLTELRDRGLMFLDSRTSPQSVGYGLALEAGMAAAQRDVFLDNEGSFADVRENLARTEQVARERGSAIAIGHPRDATLAALEPWLADMRARGFVAVPLTAVVKRRIFMAERRERSR
ncbi:MAG: hypothetical protein OHK0024_36850 [Thalassobaculales bacterium]